MEPPAELREALAILGEVDRVLRRPEDPVPGVLERPGELERRLAAELDDDALGPLAVADLEHLLGPQRLEVEPVGGVVVGGDRLRVAVDHHGLVAELAERARRVDAAVVELDPLADAVRPRPEDDDARLLAVRTGLVFLAPGRVEVVRGRLDLRGARVHAAVGRADTARPAGAANVVLACLPRLRQIRVRPAQPLEAQPVLGDQVGACARGRQSARGALELRPEPRVEAFGEVVERRPRGRRAGVELPRAHRLQERLGERAADPHRLTDGLHLRPEGLVGARELLEGEARELDDDVVERRLEARRRRAREVVRDLVERVADSELRGHLGDRVARRLAGEGRRTGHARVHLDHPQLAGLAFAGELDVGAAGLDADRPDDLRGSVPELLEGLVRQGHLRRDGDGVARVHPHRVEVLDRADDDDVVAHVTHDLELELVPADQRLLHEDLAYGALLQPALEEPREVVGRPGDAAAMAPEREGRAQDEREREVGRQLIRRGHDHGLGNAQADGLHRLAEEPAVLRAADRVEAGADQLDAELVEDAVLREAAGEVESGLAAERREERVWPLALEHAGDPLHVERLQVRAVGVAGVGHDRGRVRVDDDRAVALGAEDLERLASGVVELARLPDDDRARADHADGLEIRPPGHT